MKILHTFLLLFIALLWVGCASKSPDDPLKHSKHLILDGHKSLYENGAISIPFTKIKLIPPGPTPMEVAKEFIGVKAKLSFRQALNNALESVYIIPGGTAYAYDLSEKIFDKSMELSNQMSDTTRDGSIWLVKKSSDIAKEHITGSLKKGLDGGLAVYQAGDSLENLLYKEGKKVLKESNKQAKMSFDTTKNLAKNIHEGTLKVAKDTMQFSVENFITGYGALPKKLTQRGRNIKEAVEGSGFSKAYSDAENFRKESSLYFSSIVGDTFSNYGKNIGNSFSKMKDAFSDNIESEGLMLSTMKSMGWALRAILYDAIVEPIARLGYGSVGFVSSNGLIFPVHVVANEGVALTKVAAEISYNSVAAVYDIVAPTTISAVAALLGSAEYVVGETIAATALVAGGTSSVVQTVAGHAASGISHTAGFIGGKSIKYIGVPVAATGIALGNTAYGVVASTASAATAATIFSAGEVANLSTKAFGTVLSTTTLATGAVASVAAASAVGVYELSKAVVVPTGYAFSSATILGYGALSHVAAHSLLAVSDAAYVVLSLEGPRWVLYAVSGKIKGSEELPVGAVLDLKKMQEAGEVISYVPVSEAQMKDIVKASYYDLPVMKNGQENKTVSN